MKLYQVDWMIPISSSILGHYGASTPNKKAFTTKEKAEEFYKQLHTAAGLLNISGSISSSISEVEID